MRMLVCDDDPVYRTLLAGLARHVAHEPLIAADGEEGWELYLRWQPRVILTDWMMPITTGVELTQRIRSVESDVRPIVIICTTLSAREHVLDGFRAGADDYVAKPFDQEIFAARITAAYEASKHAMQREEAAERRVVEKVQPHTGPDSAELMESFDTLSKLYIEQRAYAKARAFLRRQERIARQMGDLVVVSQIRRTLEELQGESDAVLDEARETAGVG